jgi:hypothetical protein
VVLSDSRIQFTGRVNALAHRQYIQALAKAKKEGLRELVLDFSVCEGAFLNGMVPIIASVDGLHRDGVQTTVILPTSEELKRLFHNANWAHFLQPDQYDRFDQHHDRHVAAHRFTTADEQQILVNAFMDVVMRQMTLERDVIAGLEWSINEVTDNVLNHAQAVDGGIVQVSTFREAGKVAFAVADAGRGVLSSLREGHPHLRTDGQALGEAVKGGVTRNPDAGQGNGLAGSLRIAMMSGGSMELTSGQAQLVVRGSESRTYERDATLLVVGTIVYLELGLKTAFHLADALGFSGKPHQPVDIIDTLYHTDAGDAMILRLKDEASGFGSRPLGRQIRNKCMNLLNAEPAKPLVLEWSGVPLISSSFADELVGKLFVELGPLSFAARVRNQGLEALVRGLIDKAILQRSAQTFRGTGLMPSK